MFSSTIYGYIRASCDTVTSARKIEALSFLAEPPPPYFLFGSETTLGFGVPIIVKYEKGIKVRTRKATEKRRGPHGSVACSVPFIFLSFHFLRPRERERSATQSRAPLWVKGAGYILEAKQQIRI